MPMWTSWCPRELSDVVPYTGILSDIVFQLVGGLKAGMGYLGCDSIEALRKNAAS